MTTLQRAIIGTIIGIPLILIAIAAIIALIAVSFV